MAAIHRGHCGPRTETWKKNAITAPKATISPWEKLTNPVTP